MFTWLLDQAYDADAWHGPNLLESVRSVTADAAAWHPASGQRSIWEIVVHAAYWKHRACKHLSGDESMPFPHEGEDWFVRPEAGSSDLHAAWKRDLALLHEMHSHLRAIVASFALEQMDEAIFQTLRRADVAAGIAFHDVYHAGQVQMLRGMYDALHAA